MRATPIPDKEIWAGAHRIVVSPPDGDLTNDKIRPVEMLVEEVPDFPGVPVFSALCTLEPGDLETLRNEGNIWITFYGGVIPFCATVAAAAESADPDGNPVQR